MEEQIEGRRNGLSGHIGSARGHVKTFKAVHIDVPSEPPTSTSVAEGHVERHL
jgi:hypothetical protein